MRHSGLLLVLVACANNVPQDRATGPDGKVKGAKPIVFENGEAKVRGIVTYPGGDRIDWKLIELPEGQRGKLDLQLSWRTPRPGLQLAFDVFDQWNAPVAATKSPQRKGGRIRSVSINDARGKYFIRVFAPKRGDAGQYTLVASFTEDKIDIVDPSKISVADPPKLPAVPPPDEVCAPFDINNKACENACPEYGPPAGWPGCRKRDESLAAAEAAKAAAAARQECLNSAPKQVDARIIHVEVGSDQQVNVKLDIGSQGQAKLDSGWTGRVLISGTTKPHANGAVKIIRVGTLQTLGSSRLTTDQLTANPRVRLSPPPPVCP